ncbi:MAG: molybdate ABC transporter substrate-binding protein [Verrucomicrobiales bacterium]|nr:molybdate ABC transporter substrate-binding protein [Verrucomicrobiales bacterium]
MKNFRILSALLALVALINCGGPANDGETTELVLFCAAGLKSPVTEIAELYEKETGVAVRMQFGGSGTLLSSLQIAPGDIYLAADSSYTDEAMKRDLISGPIPVARMKAGIGVAKGNPKNIVSLADLSRKEIRAGIGNPDAASIGKFTKKILSKHNLWENLSPVLVTPTVNELANAVKLQSVDAVILWNVVAQQYPDVDFISVPEFDAEKKGVTIAVTKSSKDPAASLKFCQFLSGADKGALIFQKHGFELETASQ